MRTRINGMLGLCRLTAGILALATLATLVLAALGAQRAEAINNGRDVGFGAYPEVAFVEDSAGSCTGTLLRPQWALTAAHCLDSSQGRDYAAFLGGSTSETRKGYSVAAVRKHPSYQSAKTPRDRHIGFDVALLRLAEPVTGVKPAALAGPADMEKAIKGVDGPYALGWGRLSEKGLPTTTLQVKKPTLVPRQVSRTCARFPQIERCQVLSLAARFTGGGVCPGDSGGPLMSPVNGNRRIVFGDLSMGNDCDRATANGYYANLAYGPARDWVLRNATTTTRKRAGDVLWHNEDTGETQISFMDQERVVDRATVVDESGEALSVGAPWRIVGTGHMDSVERTDIVWHNADTGETQIWFMNRERVVRRATVVDENRRPITDGPPLRVAGVSDMDRDGYGDIVWHNADSGETRIWFMERERIRRRAAVVEGSAPTLVGAPWRIRATSDMNADLKGDIVWHNAETGETQVWLMNKESILRRYTVVDGNAAALVRAPWSIVAAHDIDDDRWGDIVWHNADTGETQIWFMNKESILRRATVLGGAGGGSSSVGGLSRPVGAGIFDPALTG